MNARTALCVCVGQWFKTLNYFTHVREDVHEEFSKEHYRHLFFQVSSSIANTVYYCLLLVLYN